MQDINYEIQRAVHYFRDWFFHLVKKVALGLLATIALGVVAFCAYAPFPALLPIWKSCFVTLFSTACDSASITSVVSKWQSFSFIFNQGNREK
jgi:hypothetical protein